MPLFFNFFEIYFIVSIKNNKFMEFTTYVDVEWQKYKEKVIIVVFCYPFTILYLKCPNITWR